MKRKIIGFEKLLLKAIIPKPIKTIAEIVIFFNIIIHTFEVSTLCSLKNEETYGLHGFFIFFYDSHIERARNRYP